MNNVWDCNKKPDDCPYRWDYRGCIKENCPFPDEYKKKEEYLISLNKNPKKIINLLIYLINY